MKMRTYHLEAILQFLENATVEGETRISFGEDSYMTVALLREAHVEIERIDKMIDTLHRSNTDLRDTACRDIHSVIKVDPKEDKFAQSDKWKAIAFNSGVATGSSTNSSWPNFIYFSDGADSDPHMAIDRGKQDVWCKTGVWPDTLVIGPEVRCILMSHPDLAEIRDWKKYTEEVLKLIQTGAGDPPSLSPYGNQLMADFFGLDQIIVDDDFGKDMLLCRASDGASGLLFKNTIC